MFKNRKILDILRRHQEAPEALVLTGFRRVGKTSVMRHIFESLPTANKIFLDLESPVNQKLFQPDNYENIKSSLATLGLNFNHKAFIFLDEIQNLPHIPSVIKYLSDHYAIKFYLTGSSSFYLKNLFSESLAGRKFIFELYPLDFAEFLHFKNSPLSPQADWNLLSGLYEEYLTFGGFPSVVLQDSAEKKLLQLDDILGSYFNLDVKNLSHFRDNANLKNLLFLLSSRVGSKPEITKLADALGVSRQTVYDYLTFFEQTYLIHFLRPLSGSRDIQIKHQPKIYFCDTGLLNRLTQISRGQLFENKIFNQLFTHLAYSGTTSPLQDHLHYYQLKTGTEIDFIVQNHTAYEVKLLADIHDIRHLAKSTTPLHLTNYYVISLTLPKTPSPYILPPSAI